MRPKLSKTRDRLEQFGFSFRHGSAHSSRTIMLEDLTTLLNHVGDENASPSDYLFAIHQQNCLRKRSNKTRMLSYRHLVHLYTLDPSIALFHALRYFWQRDSDSHPGLALLCSYARDPILRMSAGFVTKQPLGVVVSTREFEELIESKHPGRFSDATLKSTAQNISATWTKAGLLHGRVRKIRSQGTPSIGSVCYALFLGHLVGLRGEQLFSSEYLQALDCLPEAAIEHALNGSQCGWIIFKKIGRVMEVRFPQFESLERCGGRCEQN